MAQYSILSFFLSISIINSASWEGPYLFNLNDDPYKKLLICVQQKVI